MKIALLGAGGTIGRRILDEALRRGHQVTAVVRDPAKFGPERPGLTVAQGDALDPASVAAAVAGHDAVISAVGPKLPQGDPQVVVKVAQPLIEGIRRAGVHRLVIVGGAGSLEVAPGLQLVDTPEFPAAWKGAALAHRDALNLYRSAPPDVEWTYISPAAMIAPGERTGRYRTGGDQLLVDGKGESHISAEDYAAGLLDEVEHPKNVRRRMTIAY